jgi:hypothetical protein
VGPARGRHAVEKGEGATLVVEGEELLLADVLARHGVSRPLYLSRLRIGWDRLRAATTSGDPRARYIKVNGTEERLSRVLAKHGVSYGTYAARLGLGWDRVRAATAPPGTRGVPLSGEVRPTVVIAAATIELDEKPEALATVLARHGISDQTYRRRVRMGWVPERAATTPQSPSNWARAQLLIGGKPELLVDVLARHGVRTTTFYGRVRRGWGLVRAATTPPGTAARRRSHFGVGAALARGASAARVGLDLEAASSGSGGRQDPMQSTQVSGRSACSHTAVHRTRCAAY